MVENENEVAAQTGEERGIEAEAPRRRARRAYGPKPASTAVSAESETGLTASDAEAPVAPVEADQEFPAEGHVAQPTVDEGAPVAVEGDEPDADDEPAPVAAEGAADEADDEPAPARRRPPLAVVFQAPPLPTPSPEEAVAEPADEGEDEEDAEADTGAGTSRRSRRRRRRTGGQAQATDQPSPEGAVTEVLPKAKPVRQAPEPITEPQKLKGSTRLEAKRQRRRDGRDAGRRRAVVTEAEFLARREAVDRVMVVRSAGGRIELGVLEDGILVEHYVAKSQNVSLIGNVYLGRVQNVLPSMEAAFVDIGRGRNAVLYSGEVDWDAASERLGEKGQQARRIELALKSGDRVLVQVTKDPVGHKGARLTSAVSLPGRYLVYVPGGSMSGISRKLPDTERARLKRILKEALPDSAGVIVRTAAEGATEEQLTIDVQRLANQWAEIERLTETANAPALLHSEPDLLVKIVRDVFNEDFARLVISGDDARATIERYLGQVAPELLDRVERWTEDRDVFAAHRVDEQIEKALDRKVWLPSGGSLVIDRTEAMTVIDVNTGKFVGSGGNLEETVTKNNLEAAEEIVRQLRLRDTGGIIVIDFIDMVLESNRDLVLRRLVECLSRDRTKHQVAEVTSLGLVQMTRKKLGVGLAESVSEGADAGEPRQEQQPGRRRRGGGNGNGGGQQQAPQKPAVQTHAITDDAKTMLARIAGATIPHPEHADEDRGAPAALAEPDAARTGQAGPDASAADAGTTDSAETEQREPAAQGGADPSGEQPAPTGVVLDLPTGQPRERQPERVPDEAKASLLDSVLGALPQPKRAGEGRRSRRVSTPALTPTKTD